MEMGGSGVAVFISIAVVAICFVGLFGRWINDLWHTRGLDPSSLPPGSMGWPIIGELLDFLWCFKFQRRPDDFIAKRKARYVVYFVSMQQILTVLLSIVKITWRATNNCLLFSPFGPHRPGHSMISDGLAIF